MLVALDAARRVIEVFRLQLAGESCPGCLVLLLQQGSPRMGYIADMSPVSNFNYKRRAFSSGCLAGLVSRQPSSSDILDGHMPAAGRGERAFLEDNHSLSRTSFVREVQKEDWARMSRRYTCFGLAE